MTIARAIRLAQSGPSFVCRAKTSTLAPLKTSAAQRFRQLSAAIRSLDRTAAILAERRAAFGITAPIFTTASKKYAWLTEIQAAGKMTSLQVGKYVRYDIFVAR